MSKAERGAIHPRSATIFRNILDFCQLITVQILILYHPIYQMNQPYILEL